MKKKIKKASIFFAKNIDDVFLLSTKTKFDLVIADIAFDNIDSYLLISKFILLFDFESRLLFFDEYCSEQFIKKCKNIGVFVLNKNSSEDEICKKIDECFKNRLLNKVLLSSINDETKASVESKMKVLSTREIECAIMLMQGNTNVEISKNLGLSATTVSTYKKRILEKTKTKNIVELTRLFN